MAADPVSPDVATTIVAPVVPARQLGVHQPADELQRDVLERERRAVPQLEQVDVRRPAGRAGTTSGWSNDS